MVAIPESTALIFGKTFGKHNFSYFISPKKTWEGFAGQYIGIVLAIFVIEAIQYVFGMERMGLTICHIFIIGLYLIPVSILGDLMESIFKRAVNVKDSNTNNVIGKGLGGVLDKFDSFGVAWITMVILIRYYRPQDIPT